MTSAAQSPDFPFEVFRTWNGHGWREGEICIEVDWNTWTQDADVSALEGRAEWQATVWNDRKLALRGIKVQGGLLRLALRHTTWLDVQSNRFGTKPSGVACLTKEVDGAYKLRRANIFAVHCICLTADNFVPIFRRSFESSYYPGALSASFEEGLECSDIDAGSAVLVAARRGAAEEIWSGMSGLPMSAMEVLSIIVEQEDCNPAAVVLIRLPHTAKEIEGCFNSGELMEGSLRFLDARLAPLKYYLTHWQMSQLWHPTSRYRLRILGEHLHGRDFVS